MTGPAAWWDVFEFDQAPRVLCPDCGHLSPVCRDVYEAALWADRHDCEATP